MCLFGASVLLFEYGFMSSMLFLYGHPPVSQAVLIIPAVLAMGRPLGILIGGLCVAPDSSRHRWPLSRGQAESEGATFACSNHRKVGRMRQSRNSSTTVGRI